jgi:hypothetical protein
MKKRGGGVLENETVFYVVCLIALFNIVAYVTARDWNSIIVFILLGLVCYKLKLGNTLSLVLAIIGSNIVKTNKLMLEGLEVEKKEEKEKEDKEEKEKKEPVPHEKKIESASELKEKPMTLEGLTQKASNLMDRQEQLHKLAGQLEPMMKQAQGMMNSLPKGFLEDAMKKIKK